ncbi:MAG: hypothetical protein O9972_22870 [Burkholderiales bacterium]|nr:hypothetical protein [Burkholderiales bacterium]
MPKSNMGPGHMCAVPGCTNKNTPARFGVMCAAHRDNRIRNGHAQQKMLLNKDAKPFYFEARQTLELNYASSVYEILVKRWQALVARAQSVVDRWEAVSVVR